MPALAHPTHHGPHSEHLPLALSMPLPLWCRDAASQSESGAPRVNKSYEGRSEFCLPPRARRGSAASTRTEHVWAQLFSAQYPAPPPLPRNVRASRLCVSSRAPVMRRHSVAGAFTRLADTMLCIRGAQSCTSSHAAASACDAEGGRRSQARTHGQASRRYVNLSPSLDA